MKIKLIFAGSSAEFRLGRRASDGFVGRQGMPFTKKLEGARAGGVAELADKTHVETMSTWAKEGKDTDDKVNAVETKIPDLPLNVLCSPAKRPSLPGDWKMDNAWLQCGPGNTQMNLTTEIGAPSSQLHRQLMTLRLQNRRCVEQGTQFREKKCFKRFRKRYF